MECSLNGVYAYIALAIAALVAALVLAALWVTAIPLFAAAALVATVAYVLIPKIKSELQAYAACRGPGKCSLSISINTLGEAAGTLSVVSFIVAAALQLTALALIASWFLSWLGLSMEAAVAILVKSGMFACAITALILLGVLTNAIAFKNCMDNQSVASAGSEAALSGRLGVKRGTAPSMRARHLF
jgi:hypothetical protein